MGVGEFFRSGGRYPSLRMTPTGRFFNIAALALAVALSAPFAQGDANKLELRESMRSEALKLINRDRVAAGLRPVALDPFASELADRYCETQIRNRTTGHFTTDGLTPYMRYSFAGGDHGLSENAAAWSANYRFPDSTVPDMIRRSHDSMMRELPPHDGHRRTILDAAATHVGIGLAWEKGEFRMAHEFVRRYIDWSRPFVRTATTGSRIRAEGKPFRGFDVDATSIYYEPHPQEMSAFVANSIQNYSLPKSRLDIAPSRVNSGRPGSLGELARNGRSSGDLFIGPDGSFVVSVPTDKGPGVYTVVIWLRKSGTKELIAASNVAIRVEASSSNPMPMLGTR